MSERSLHLRRIIISALFLALALVFRTFFRMYVPLMGETGMRLSLHGLFSTAPAILFGPVYGAMVSGLTDFIGFFLSPTGGWIPWLTMTAVLGGFTRGWLWLVLKNREPRGIRRVLISIGVVLIIFGGYNFYAFRADGLTRHLYGRTPERQAAWALGMTDAYGVHWHIQSTRTEYIDADGQLYWRTVEMTEAIFNAPPHTPLTERTPEWRQFQGRRVIEQRYGYNDDGEWGLRSAINADESSVRFKWLYQHRITRMAVNRSFAVMGQTTQLSDFIAFTTGAAMGTGALFLFLFGLDFVLRRVLKNQPLSSTTALVLAMMIPAMLVSSINTFILRQTVMTAWQLLPFFIVWLPRVLQSMATTTLNILFLTFLLDLCKKLPHMNILIRK